MGGKGLLYNSNGFASGVGGLFFGCAWNLLFKGGNTHIFRSDNGIIPKYHLTALILHLRAALMAVQWF